MFNRNEHIQKMLPFAKELAEDLKKDGFCFVEKDGDLDNVIFSKDGIEIKMSYMFFFRFCGISRIQKVINKQTTTFNGKQVTRDIIELSEITPRIFYLSYVKNLILTSYGKKLQ